MDKPAMTIGEQAAFIEAWNTWAIERGRADVEAWERKAAAAIRTAREATKE